jgi:hypothetical protein
MYNAYFNPWNYIKYLNVTKGKSKMNISNILKENLESFYPWSDSDTPPLDTNKKTFVEKEKENDEFFEGWRASM